MPSLSPQGEQAVAELAARYAFSPDAVMAALQAVTYSGGSMAQFSHPQMGGGCQWMRGGMTMVGDMFDSGLKARVDGLCTDLANRLASENLFAPEASAPQPSPEQPTGGSGNWWPAEFGIPSSTGGQNDVRYAVFPLARRLVIDMGGRITVYDSVNHQIGGVSQQQGSGSSLLFSSQYGYVRVDDLPVIPARW